MCLLKFVGTVKFRSSLAGVDKSTGEANLFRINPDREMRFCRITGWNQVAHGSLNLRVDSIVVSELEMMTPVFREDPDDIKYPDGRSNIPKFRGGYSYFSGEICKNGHRQAVLVRRATQRPIDKLVEIYAPVHLVTALALLEGDTVEVRIV